MPLAHWGQPGLTWGLTGLVWGGQVPNPNNTMPNDNRISATILAADKTLFLTKVNEATALLPFLINLTPTERRRLPSIGIERAGMLDDCSQLMTAHSGLVPTYVNMTEVNKDLALFRDMMPLLQTTTELCEKVDDTMKAISADLFVAFTA